MFHNRKSGVIQPQPSAIVIDGTQNLLSVARSLVLRGVTVYTLNDASQPVRFSRGVRWLRMADGGSPSSWESFLLGPESDYLTGSVLLACSDEAINLISHNAEKLSRKFLLEEADPKTRLCLLDKLQTYAKAQEAAIPTVAYELVGSDSQLEKVVKRFRFPVILKPLYSPDALRLGAKFIMAKDETELIKEFHKASRLGVKSVVMEFVPGGDNLLCSYYTYMDDNGVPLVEFTKRLLRRSPIHSGIASYHITDWNAEAAELGRKFFRHVKLRGIGNIEFKRDLRDGQLKIIEANARFTLADPLLVKSGVNLAAITYARLTRQPLPPSRDYKRGVVLWLPAEDIRAFLQLHARRKITFFEWFKSVLRTDVFPYFSWRDPLPSLHLNVQRALQLIRMSIRRFPSRIAILSHGFRKETLP